MAVPSGEFPKLPDIGDESVMWCACLEREGSRRCGGIGRGGGKYWEGGGRVCLYSLRVRRRTKNEMGIGGGPPPLPVPPQNHHGVWEK